MKGYKVTNLDGSPKCGKDIIFEVGKVYEETDIEVSKKGFHFCSSLISCYNYYRLDDNISNYKYFEIEALGKVLGNSDDIFCTDKLKIIKELDEEIVIKLLTGRVTVYGDIFWYKNGKYHREDGPAMIKINKLKIWYLDKNCTKEHKNKIILENNPDRITYNGEKRWYLNGKLHREDGPAIESDDGAKCWYQNGERHREDGPAMITYNGNKFWYQNGYLHRDDGPATELANGKNK